MHNPRRPDYKLLKKGTPRLECALSEQRFLIMIDVFCLCAAWCNVCRDFMPSFLQLEAGDCRLHWVDIEEHDAALGALDIENFPTIIVANAAGDVLYAGPIEPQIAKLQRLMRAATGQALAAIDDVEWIDAVSKLKAEPCRQ